MSIANTEKNSIENLDIHPTYEPTLVEILKSPESKDEKTTQVAPTDALKGYFYYFLQVEGDPNFRMTARSARKGGAKAEFTDKKWFYLNKEDAEKKAKELTTGKRKVTVIRAPNTHLDELWHGSKDEARLAKTAIINEAKKQNNKTKKQEIIDKCNEENFDATLWLPLDTLPETDDLGRKFTEKERGAYALYKPEWDKATEEQEELDLRDSDNHREREALNEVLIRSDHKYGNYTVTPEGIFFIDADSAPKLICPSPIWPEAYLRGMDGKSHTLLTKVYDGERDHKIAIPRRVITKWAELSEILLDLGQSVPTYPADQKHLQNFLMQARPEKLLRCVDKSGWHGDQYIFPDGEVFGKTKDSNENVYPLNEACPKGVERKGSLQEWQDNILKLCAHNSRLIFSIGVSLSSPCLHLVEDEGGVFNFKGDSSIGKTRCLMVAISVFGSPEFKRSWRTTSNGLEGICSLHNDCLLALDEFGQSDAREVGEIAYMYSQGIGKQRSSRDGSPRETKTWRGMLFSTGEVGIADHIQDDKRKAKAGQLVRVLDIPAQVKNAYGCFEKLHGHENGIDGERFAEKIKEVCGKYYGTAGREFIKAMIEWGVERAKKLLKSSRDDFAEKVASRYDGQVKRVANRFGLIYAALSLGVELGILSTHLTKEMCEDSVKQCFIDWISERGTTGKFESHSIINQVTGLINENSDSKFIPKNEVDDKKIRNTVWGYKEGPIFYILPKAFGDICKGFDEQSAKVTLKDSGLLIPDNQGKFSKLVRIPAHTKAIDRFYVINLDNHKDDEE